MSKNRLASEKSPYLLQHAKNPVDWYPWGEEAFAVARATNRPVFLSVGYSTCHWCHVMAHESFENPEVAQLLNQFFVNIKVDREERPDVDRVYMTFIQAIAGSGGWPMSVWLTPEGEPFFGGTYFAPEDRYGQPSFPRIVRAIHELWRRDPQQLRERGKALFSALEQELRPEPSRWSAQTVAARALEQLASEFDQENGGFGGAPKFPRPVMFEFLLSCAERDKRALQMTLFSLRKIALGGIYDHLGGGFHRYSVDEHWHVPHFEKMLYDQAQLVIVFAKAFQLSHDPLLGRTAIETLEYMMRDLSHPQGGFYSAEDADSEVSSTTRSSDGNQVSEASASKKRAHHAMHKKAEGAFYLWKISEINNLLGLDLAPLFCKAYGVLEQGNVLESHDPQGEFKGKNILASTIFASQSFSQEIGLPLEVIENSLACARHRLFLERNKRPRPHLDDKILAAWNGLAISALARCGIIFQRRDFIKRAIKAAQFLHVQMWKEGKLIRSWRQGAASSIAGFAVDYAFLIQGLLDLYEADFDHEWLLWALELQTVLDNEFWDESGGSYFETPTIHDGRLPRSLRENYDGAEPAANSVCAFNLLRFSRMFRESQFEERAKCIFSTFSEVVVPIALPFLLKAALFQEHPPEEIVIAGPRGAAETRALAQAARRKFRPNCIFLLADGDKGSELLSRSNPLFQEMKPIHGQPAAYICKEYTCQAPTVNPEEL